MPYRYVSVSVEFPRIASGSSCLRVESAGLRWGAHGPTEQIIALCPHFS